MSKRASERFSSAHDLAEDLRHFLTEHTVVETFKKPFLNRTSIDMKDTSFRASIDPTRGLNVCAMRTACLINYPYRL